MKRSKSGAQKRKEAATARDVVAKLPKMTDFFKITEQSRPGTSTERNEENFSVQEKEDYDDQHQSDCEFPENVSCDLPANTQPSTGAALGRFDRLLQIGPRAERGPAFFFKRRQSRSSRSSGGRPEA